MLEFDEPSHTYRYGGVVVPSVTQCLKPLTCYDKINSDVLEVARLKGIAVHKLVELHCAGTLDIDGLPLWMIPVLRQWDKWVDETGFKVVASELRVYHPTYKVAGTLDLFGELSHSGNFAFVDIKRSFLGGDTIGYQTAAYQNLYAEQENSGKALRAKRFALRLREDSPYKMQEYKDKSDWTNFLTCLNFKRLQERMAK